MEDLPELTPINCYNVTRGKLAASVKWLIGYVYGGSIPDRLDFPVCCDNNKPSSLTETVKNVLTDASLYSSAAAKIFKDQDLINQPHSVVLWALSNHSIPLLISGEEASIDERMLASVDPFHQEAHLAVMDALMTAHMRSIITIERVVTAVQKYTTVDPREEPMDSVDALLFWINKICLLVRDDIEKSQSMTKREENQFGSIVVPEMEDLYEDMCDGACLCALIAFYSDQMNMQRICFNDPMSISDCQYNLELLNGIPDLRGQTSDRQRYFPRNKQQQPGMTRAMSLMSTDSLMSGRGGAVRSGDMRMKVQMGGPDTTNFRRITQIPTDETVRYMPATQPSGSYERSDSMPAASVRLALEEKRRDFEKKRYLESNQNEVDRVQKQKDAFFALMQRIEKANDSRPRTSSELSAVAAAIPSSNPKQYTTVQESVDSLRKQLEKLNAQHEELSRQVHEDRRMSHAISQPAIHSDLAFGQDQQVMMDPYCSPPACMVNSCIQPSRQSSYAIPYNDPVFQPVIAAQPFDPQQQLYMEGYNIPPMLNSTMNTSLTPSMPGGVSIGPSCSVSPYILRQPSNVQYPRPVLASSPVSTIIASNQGQYCLQNDVKIAGNSNSANSSFRLHQNNASLSRLDPPLELNNTLTNWGLTYKAGHISRPQRRTWENGTFIKSEMDLVNQPDVVPHAPSEQDQMRPSASTSFPRKFHAEQDQSQSQVGTTNDDSSCEAHSDSTRQEAIEQQEIGFDSFSRFKHQQSPPKDPASSPFASSLAKQRHSTTGGSQFIVDDVGLDRSSNGITREMEAKREALLARTLRRREQREQKSGELEAINAERRQAELEKQEAADQRKRERELNRQRALEAYKKKKMDRELEMSSSQIGRGHSQPPTSRPKGNLEMSRSRTLQRPSRTQSSVGETNGSSSARSAIASIAEPALKLYSKYVPKSNRTIIINALHYSVFPGAVWDKQRNEVLNELAKNDSKHLLLLFKDQKCRYMGAYSWDQQSDTAHRIHGKGPTICNESMMFLMFKYDSGGKSFSQIPTKHLSATIDGFTLKEQYMQTPKIPHSTSNHSGMR